MHAEAEPVRRLLTKNATWTGTLRNRGVIAEDDDIWTMQADQSTYMQSDELDALFAELIDAYPTRADGKKRRKTKPQRLAFCCLLNALFEALHAKPDEHVGVLWPTANNSEPRSRYRSDVVSSVSRSAVKDLLVEAGYIEFFRGGGSREGFRSLLSVALPTSKLDSIWADRVSQKPFIIVADQSSELVLLRAIDKSPEDYKDTDNTNRQRATLSALNTVNQAAVWSSVNDTGSRRFIQPLSLVCRRLFREGSFNRGGRVYCGAQGISQVERATIEIDGKQTTELDFQGMSAIRPYLLLLKSRPDLRDEIQAEVRRDPFEVAEHPREVIKMAVNVALNNKNAKSAAGALRKALDSTMTYKDAAAAIDATVQRHPLIKPYFFQCMDAELEYAEAVIMWAAVEYFALSAWPLLPIHDGLLCRTEDADRAEAVLRHQVEHNYGLELVIRRKS